VADDQLYPRDTVGRYLEILTVETAQRGAGFEAREHAAAREVGHLQLIVSLAKRASVV
jgi:hypothetical protein